MYSYKPEPFIILDILWSIQQYTTYILFPESLDAYYIGFTGHAINSRLAKHLPKHKDFTARDTDPRIAYTGLYSIKYAVLQREKLLNPAK